MILKILLYIFTVIFAILALMGAVGGHFNFLLQILFYVLAAATLFASVYFVVSDLRSGAIKVVKRGIAKNPFAHKVTSDHRLRTLLFAVPGLTGNIIFAIFNGVIGFVSHSAWFGSLAAYYILLSTMRIWAVYKGRALSKIETAAERMAGEISVYQVSSYLFVLLAIVLESMVVLLHFSLGGKTYPGLLIYAAATYTFYKITMSIINIIKEGKRQSPLLMSIRKIGYIDACVSILILQTALFAAFGDVESFQTKLLNGLVGTLLAIMVLAMGFHGIGHTKRMKKKLEMGGSFND